MDYIEDLWIEIETTSGPVFVGTVCKHPTNRIEIYDRFSENLLNTFNDLNSNNRPFYALGNYNIDVIKARQIIMLECMYIT